MGSQILRVSVVALGVLAGGALTADSPAVTFHKDVESILQKNCQTCHRPGQVAPMSFMTYESARPYARAMKTAVRLEKDAAVVRGPALRSVPERSLAQSSAISRRSSAGRTPARRKAPPATRRLPSQWPEGWFIKPDIIVEGPTTDVPATLKNNVVEWITVIMPSGFTKDTWVTSVQIKPEFPEITHHLCISYVPHNPGYKYGVAYWTDKERDGDGSALPDKGPTFLGRGTARSSDDDPTPITVREGAARAAAGRRGGLLSAGQLRRRLPADSTPPS